MAAIFFFGIVLLLLFLCSLPFIAKESSESRKLEDRIGALPDFTPALRFDQPDRTLALMLDPDSGQFAVSTRSVPSRIYSFDQLVAVEVERNGISLQKTNRGSQAMGAAVGGLLLGPAGLLLGGLTGSKRNEERVKRLSLRLFTNDLHTPVTEVIFFDSASGMTPDSEPVMKAARQLENWHGRFRVILHGNQQAATPSAPAPVSPPPAGQPSTFGRRRGLVAQQ